MGNTKNSATEEDRIMQRQIVSAICALITVAAIVGCTKIRGKLSESDWGNKALKTYDAGMNKLGEGVNYSTEKAGQFITDADDKWLRELLKSIAKPAPPSTPSVPPPAPDTPSTATLPPPSSMPGEYPWPIAAGQLIKVTSQYGWRSRGRHHGIDIGGPTGTPIYAVASGTVIFAANHHNGYGNLVIIQHVNGITSHYAHNKIIKVKKGQVVTQGATIALLGATGRATGPHLHFEIRRGDRAVNPCRYLKPNSHLVCRK